MMVVVRPFFFLSRPSCRVTIAAATVSERWNNGKVKDGARTYAVGNRQ